MGDRDSRIEDKLDKVAEAISEIKVTLGEQHVVLEEHTRRSLANEQNVELLREQFTPIQHHYIIVNFCIKCFTILLGSGTILALVAKFFKH